MVIPLVFTKPTLMRIREMKKTIFEQWCDKHEINDDKITIEQLERAYKDEIGNNRK